MLSYKIVCLAHNRKTGICVSIISHIRLGNHCHQKDGYYNLVVFFFSWGYIRFRCKQWWWFGREYLQYWPIFSMLGEQEKPWNFYCINNVSCKCPLFLSGQSCLKVLLRTWEIFHELGWTNYFMFCLDALLKHTFRTSHHLVWIKFYLLVKSVFPSPFSLPFDSAATTALHCPAFLAGW